MLLPFIESFHNMIARAVTMTSLSLRKRDASISLSSLFFLAQRSHTSTGVKRVLAKEGVSPFIDHRALSRHTRIVDLYLGVFWQHHFDQGRLLHRGNAHWDQPVQLLRLRYAFSEIR